MDLIIVLIVTLSLFLLVTAVNPVKICASLILARVGLFTYIFCKNSSIWIRAIFFIIFIGGIIIMFIILTSLIPNEKNLKVRKKLTSILILSARFVSLRSSIAQVEIISTQQIKVIFFSNESFETLILAILLYFLVFVYILSKESSSLRSFSCY